MPTINAGASTAVTVAVGTYLEGTGAGMAVIGPAAVVEPLTAGDSWQIGPFDRATLVSITAGSAITYTVKDNMRDPSEADKLPLATVAALQALVSADGIQTWANRGLALAAGLTRCFITDVGIGGSYWDYLGGRWRPQARRVTLKNLIADVSNSAAPKVVMDYATIPAGLLQDGDVLQAWVIKERTGGTSDTDATDVMLGSAPTTLGTSLNLTTSALATTTLSLSAVYRWRRVSATSVRALSISGALGIGSATAALALVTGLTNMDSAETYLQVTSDLTTAGGEVAWLRGYQVELICGA